MFKKTILASLIFVASNCYSGAGSELNHFFNGLGIASNITGSHAYQTQSAGFASFGSAFVRNQVRNIQIAHIDTPSFRSGCGGIDITAGGFSFIKAGEITQFMQNILTSGAGYALNLALETELPEIAKSMQFMQKLAADMNSNNLNSCELGESLVGGLWSKNRKYNQQICQDLGSTTNVFTDWASARQKCSTGGETENMLSKAKQNKEYKDKVLVSTNVVWDSLQRNDFLKSDSALAEAYMSISGTIVFDEKGAIKTYPSLITNKDFIKALMYGGQLPVYKCMDTGKENPCLNISYSKDSYQTILAKESLVYLVQEVIQGIHQHIKDDVALTPRQNGIINMTQINVFKLISANAQQGIGIQGGLELSQGIAADLISQYLTNSLEIIRSSLAGKDLGKDNEDRLFKNIQKAQLYAESISSKEREKFNQALKTNQLIQNNVKQALSALNPMFRKAYNGVQ